MDSTVKRGRGRGRGTRARGRGRGRGKKAAVVVSSDEDISHDGAGGISTNSVAIEDVEIATSSCATLVSDSTEDAAMNDLNKENEGTIEVTSTANEHVAEPITATAANATANALQVEAEPTAATILPQTIDMEADISQLEAPTFTTISRGPPEPMLRLKWDHKVNLIGEKVLNPMIHCCDQCDKPILIYGRMIPCKHVFCLKCARCDPIKVCPRCNDKVVRVEQSGLGAVFMCTHGGSRYGNTGCRRTYLSQRDLQAHINHRHITTLPHQPLPATAMEIKQDIVSLDVHKAINIQRKLSESSTTTTIQTPSTLHLAQRSTQIRSTSISMSSIAPPSITNSSNSQSSSTHAHSSLTQANIARINTANAQECHQAKVALHQTLKKTPVTQSHHQAPETVADASYYSSVLNSFAPYRSE